MDSGEVNIKCWESVFYVVSFIVCNSIGDNNVGDDGGVSL